MYTIAICFNTSVKMKNGRQYQCFQHIPEAFAPSALADLLPLLLDSPSALVLLPAFIIPGGQGNPALFVHVLERGH